MFHLQSTSPDTQLFEVTLLQKDKLKKAAFFTDLLSALQALTSSQTASTSWLKQPRLFCSAYTNTHRDCRQQIRWQRTAAIKSRQHHVCHANCTLTFNKQNKTDKTVIWYPEISSSNWHLEQTLIFRLKTRYSKFYSYLMRNRIKASVLWKKKIKHHNTFCTLPT